MLLRRILTQAFVLVAILLGIAGFFMHVRSRDQVADFLTAEERYWLDAHDQRITVALDPRWQPDQFVEDQEIYVGIVKDFISLIERKLGVRFMRYYAPSWEKTLEAEKAGRIDIHSVLVKSPERSRDWLFTEPYMRIPVIVVMRASLKDTFSVDSIHRFRMGVGHGYGIESFIREHGQGFQLVPVESDRFGLIKAALGEIDLMVTDLASASYHIEREGLTNLRLAATLGSLYEFRFASRADLPILNSILNKALEQITREERRQIYDRWIVFDVQTIYQSRPLWYAMGLIVLVASVALGIVVVWNATLKIEVALKTRALKKARDELEVRVQERTEQLAEVNKALEHEMIERAGMANDILHISGNERARIGRDLHDSIGQQMVGVALLAQALEARLAKRFPEEAASAARISKQTNELISDMKRIIKGLLPVDVMDKGLVVAITQLARETSQLHDVKCVFECEDEDACKVRDNAMATNLYRIVQEALSNAVKHARGLKTITIGLCIQDGKGLLTIVDDGEGFDIATVTHGMGLKIMRYRAALAGGRLNVEKGLDVGTRVECEFQSEFALEDVPEV